MTKPSKIIGVNWVTKAEFRQMLERRAQRVVGCSIHKFASDLKSGKYRDIDRPGIIELAILVSKTL